MNNDTVQAEVLVQELLESIKVLQFDAAILRVQKKSLEEEVHRLTTIITKEEYSVILPNSE